MIKLGDKTDTQLGFRVLKYDTVIPGMPETRDYLLEIGGRHGNYDFGADMRARVFLFNCYFPDDVTPAAIQTAIRVLNDHLLDNWGKPKTLELVFDAETDKHYNVRYSGAQVIDATAAMARRKFTLPLIAFDPHAYGVEVTEDETITLSPQTINFEVTSGLNTPINIVLDNESTSTVEGFSFKTFDEIFNWEAT